MAGKEITIKIPSFSLKNNFWKILSLLLLVVLIGTNYQIISGRFLSSYSSPQEIGKKVIDFINNNLVQPGTSAELINVSDKGSYYEIWTKYRGTEIPVYVTKDGKTLFLQAIEIKETITQATETQTNKAQSSPNIPKRDIPDVKVFIMSYCPFGIQAVKALLPVMKLLDGKANINIHYVYYVMHGEKEVYENLRQYCIQKDQREKFYDYMLCFVQSGDYQKCINEAKIDVNKLNLCMNETDAKFNVTKNYKDKSSWLNGYYPLFLVEKDLNDKYHVGGSPTIIINDQEVSINRSPEAFKEAICSAFTNPPAECNEKLSSEVASPGIGPLTGGSSSSGSCG
ncbi:MAG: DsbA family protein [Candidatus Aenigmatarchaeota archaeon]